MIKGRSVNLRRLKVVDIPIITDWFYDMDLLCHYDRLPISAPGEIKKEFKRNIKSTDCLYYIFETKQAIPVGLTYLRNIDWRNRNTELHVMVGNSSNRSIIFGAEAEFLLLKYAFKHLNMHRVLSKVIEYSFENESLMQEVGFVREGELNQAAFQSGRFWNWRLYGLLATEFNAFMKSEKGQKYIRFFAKKQR